MCTIRTAWSCESTCLQSASASQPCLIVAAVSGTVAVDEDKGHLLIDNACDGLDLFSLPDHKWLKHFAIGFRVARLPLQVAFAEQGNVAVCGSDHGVVRLFNVDDGTEMRRLYHGSPGLINRIAVRNDLLLYIIPIADILRLDDYYRPVLLDHRRQ